MFVNWRSVAVFICHIKKGINKGIRTYQVGRGSSTRVSDEHWRRRGAGSDRVNMFEQIGWKVQFVME